jgi:hypothetical protein
MANKKILFELIQPPAGTQTSEPYELMNEMRAKYHPELEPARIALAWRLEWKPDSDHRLILGMCVKATDLQKELVAWDFVILLNREVWDEEEFTRDRKLALLDHELCHAARAKTKLLIPRIDTRGRPVWRMRGHDIEEFRCIVERHGLYKADLERFFEAIVRNKKGLPFENPTTDAPIAQQGELGYDGGRPN